jgi:hypothetical protein
MSETKETPSGDERQAMMSALFAQLVMQQANLAMMLLGKTPHPETGQTVKDLDAAQLFIDQLEMLEAKTKGNLSKEETGLLKQSLMNLRLAFVQAVESSPPAAEKQPAQPSTSAEQPKTGQAVPEEEHHKKFSKKY